MSKSGLPLLVAAIASIGLLLSAYLTHLTFIQTSGLCDLTDIFACSEVLSSPYARIQGIPVASLGAAWFGVALALSIASKLRAKLLGYLLAWSVVGMAGAAILVYIEAFLIRSICLLCTAAQSLGAVIAAISYGMARPVSRPRC